MATANAVVPHRTTGPQRPLARGKLAVFGAAGATGRELVRQATARGYEVTAFLPRHVGPAAQDRMSLRALSGDVRDRRLVEEGLAGQDAVIWTAGGLLLPGPTGRSDGVRTVVAAMQRLGVRRLVFLSALGAAEGRWRAEPLCAVFLIPVFRRPFLREAETQERYVRESRRRWTIVRPGAVFDGPRTGACRVDAGSTDTPAEPRISRVDLAAFLLRETEDPRHLRATVSVFH
jgi:putative NADH-flavin reductase